MRVVSLLPAATEIVAELGELRALVGVTHECDWPPPVRQLPRVTRAAVYAAAPAAAVDAQVRELAGSGAPMFELMADRIASLAPDLLLTQALCDVCAVSEADVRGLAASMHPAPEVVTLDGTTLEGVYADIARVGAAVGAADEAFELLAGLRTRVRSAHERLKAAHAPRPRVAVIEWTDPIYAAGHWVPELVRRAGGIDVLAEAGEHSRPRSLDDLRAGKPELLIFAPCGFDLERATTEAARILAGDEWHWARGIPAWAMDANGLITRPGPRLVRGLETLASIMHPALFGDPDPHCASAVATARPEAVGTQDGGRRTEGAPRRTQDSTR